MITGCVCIQNEVSVMPRIIVQPFEFSWQVIVAG